jgi:hypothetical protein
MLMAVVAVARLRGQRAVSQDEVFRTITGSRIGRKPFYGYWHGLVTKGCLQGVLLHNGRKSWVLTALGSEVIRLFEEKYKILEDRVSKQKAEKKKPVVYSYDEMPVSVVEELGVAYKAFADFSAR